MHNMAIAGGRVNIALAFDQNFLTPLYVLLTSIFFNNAHNNIVIHAIATGITNEEKSKIENFCLNHKANILFYNIDETYVASFATDQKSRYGLATFYRLLLPALLPQSIKKILYLDVDIVVVGDLFELYNTNIDQVPIAAVPDPVEWDRPDLGIVDRSNYFNAGVLLINVPLWISQKIAERAIDFLKKYPEKATYVDQDALNAILIDNWLKLDDKFNFTYRVVPFASRRTLRELVKTKNIIHYNESTKPWHRTSNNKLDFLYHEYFKKSPRSALNSYFAFVLSKKNLSKIIRKNIDYFYFNTPFLSDVWRKIKS